MKAIAMTFATLLACSAMATGTGTATAPATTGAPAAADAVVHPGTTTAGKAEHKDATAKAECTGKTGHELKKCEAEAKKAHKQ